SRTSATCSSLRRRTSAEGKGSFAGRCVQPDNCRDERRSADVRQTRSTSTNHTEDSMTQLLTKVDVPADVPSAMQGQYEENFQVMTKGTGRLMLFAGDQKVEHLNDDFYGTLSNGEAIAADDADPEHLFRIASEGIVVCFATQFGLIARYARDYPAVPYMVKLNSKSHLIKTSQRD